MRSIELLNEIEGQWPCQGPFFESSLACFAAATAKAENEKAFRLVLCVLKCYQIILSFNMPTKTKKMSFFEIPAFRNIILRNLKSFGESMEILFEKILWNYDDFF